MEVHTAVRQQRITTNTTGAYQKVIIDITGGTIALRCGLGGGMVSSGVKMSSEIVLFHFPHFSTEFFGPNQNRLVLMVEYRCCGLSPLPSYHTRRPVDGIFHGFSANLDDLVHVRILRGGQRQFFPSFCQMLEYMYCYQMTKYRYQNK